MAKKKIVKKKKPASDLSFLQRMAGKAKDILGDDAVFSGGDAEYGDPKYWIPTTVPALNEALDPEGRGWPGGRLIEIYGASGTAKSGIGYDFLANIQRLGGTGLLIPAEGEYSPSLASVYGVRTDELMIADTNIVEDVFNLTDNVVKEAGEEDIVGVLIDSVAGLSIREEYESEEYGRNRDAQVRAQLISKALRKLGARIPRTKVTIFMINQINEGEMAPQGFKKKGMPPGGVRIGFYCSVRCRLEMMGKYKKQKNGVKRVAGYDIKLTTEKNRLHRPYQEVEFKVDFEKGLIPKKAES